MGEFEDISVVNFMIYMGIYKRFLLMVLHKALFNLHISENLFPKLHKVAGNIHANKNVMKAVFMVFFTALANVRKRFYFSLRLSKVFFHNLIY